MQSGGMVETRRKPVASNVDLSACWRRLAPVFARTRALFKKKRTSVRAFVDQREPRPTPHKDAKREEEAE